MAKNNRSRANQSSVDIAAATGGLPGAAPTVGNQKPNMAINVDYLRQEVVRLIPKWKMIADCIEGQEAVKAAGPLYLPRPNAGDTSAANLARYESYKCRAVYYNVTRRTLDGMVGQVFSRSPIITIPDAMKALLPNIDGAGVSLDQQTRKALAFTMAFARCGILVDYPAVEGPTTVAQQQQGGIRPTITLYRPQDLINWRHRMIGAESRLELVVIRENYPLGNDGFEVKYQSSWRVLRLNDANQYTIEIFTFDEQTNIFISHVPERVVLKSDGTPWDTIPFTFIGILNNDASPDEPPMYDMATLNIAHYRNSADYEDACYLVGQPTPYFTGLTQQWVENVLKGSVQMGSRAAVALPQGATAGLLQVTPNSMPYEAMNQKETQMVALGARLMVSGNVQRTLGEAQIEESTETSILATACGNISAAYTMALGWAAQMFGAPVTDINYSLNTDFPAARLTPAERQQLVLEWQNEAITFTEMRAGLRRAGVATEDDDQAQKDIEAARPPILIPGATVDPLTGLPVAIPTPGNMNNLGNDGTRQVPKTAPGTPNGGGNQTGQ